MAKVKKNEKKTLGGDVPTNDAEEMINATMPYHAEITLEGSSDMLFHKWNVEAIQERSDAARGSKTKKTDICETYVYRNENGEICIPSEYLRMSVIGAAKFKTDPRSARKSAQDLFKAGICCLEPLASLGVDAWDYEDKRRVVIQRSGITRTRPAMKVGWRATFILMVLIPEYITPASLNESIQLAGRLIGLGDFRPTYGRFNVVEFKIL